MHVQCVTALREADLVVISPFVVIEVERVLRHHVSQHAVRAAMRELSSGEYDLAPIGPADVSLAVDVMNAYPDLEIGLTDACSVVLAKRYQTNKILTLDQSRFRAMRALDGRHFKLLPNDGV